MVGCGKEQDVCECKGRGEVFKLGGYLARHSGEMFSPRWPSFFFCWHLAGHFWAVFLYLIEDEEGDQQRATGKVFPVEGNQSRGSNIV